MGETTFKMYLLIAKVYRLHENILHTTIFSIIRTGPNNYTLTNINDKYYKISIYSCWIV